MNTEIEIEKLKHVHFVGIGGIGMSALARLYKSRGISVTGSNNEESIVTEGLQAEGITVTIGHSAELITKEHDLVVYSQAVMFFSGEDTPEIKQARELNIPVVSYSEGLGAATKAYKTIACSGTHGKTTVTAMMAHVLGDLELSPTVIVGSLLKESKTNYLKGESDWFVVEADEYARSFLSLSPEILIINNIEADHLDYYKDIEEIQEVFKELVAKLPAGGALICNLSDEKVQPVLESVPEGVAVINYTDYLKKPVELNVPGDHNRANAAGVIAACVFMGFNESAVRLSLKGFGGTWRRFEIKGVTSEGAVVIDDYAHHPTEVQATLKAAKEQFPEKKIVVVFQPHLFSRTKKLAGKFATSFVEAEHVLVLPIYAAREAPDSSITSGMLAQRIELLNPDVRTIYDFEDAEYQLKRFGGDSVIITMGAGDVTKLSDVLISKKHD